MTFAKSSAASKRPSSRLAADLKLPEPPVGVPESFDEHFKIMFDMQVLAFRAEITRVATMMFARDTSGAVYPQSGVRDGFHVASHHANNRANMDKFALINKYHVQMLAYFLEKLKATPDGDGNLLDHSMVLYGSSMSNGNQHDHDPLPVVLAGGASGQLKGGRHMQYAAAHADVESAAHDARQARRSGGSSWRQHRQAGDLNPDRLLPGSIGLDSTDLAEAALRLNTEPGSLARVLASRAKRGRDADKISRVIVERLCLAAQNLAEDRHALQALRSSWSWRLTAPLRALLEWGQIVASLLRNGTRGFRQRRCWIGFMQWLLYSRPVRSSHLFDEEYYLTHNRDVAQLGIDPLFHYCVFGAAENRKPNCLFDAAFYLQCNPDVATSMMNPLIHYLKWGAWEGRDPHPLFDSGYYLSQNSQLQKDNCNPLAHFLGPGVVEGYKPNPGFDTLAYLEQNPAAAALGMNPVLHYLEQHR